MKFTVLTMGLALSLGAASAVQAADQPIIIKFSHVVAADTPLSLIHISQGIVR